MNANPTTARLPAAIDAPGYTVALTLQAHGAQIYQCKLDDTGQLGWVFREPTATLLLDGKTIGRHYAGPSWEHIDGSVLVGRVSGDAPAPTPSDIPWLKLDVASSRGNGMLTGVTIIQRINTRGGKADAPCTEAGAFLSVPYSADYVFLKKA
jgi:hypothetical protein